MRMVEVEKGDLLQYQCEQSFGLNFEDKTPSVKLSKGDIVLYDGETAYYTKPSGEQVVGRTPWLRGAINMSWLSLMSGKPKKPAKQEKAEPKTDIKQRPPSKYDAFKGGDFNEFMQKQNQVEKKEIVREEDQIVRRMPEKAAKEESKDEKLEVAGDQVEVKNKDKSGVFSVTSSTAQPRTRKHSTVVSSAEDFGAESTIAMKGSSEKKTDSDTKKKTYTVDNTTPSVPEDASREELSRAKGVVNADESQDAKVVRKISRGSMKVQQMDGVTITNEVGSGDKPISTKASVGSPAEDLNTGAKVSRGSETVVDLSEVGRKEKPEEQAPIVEEETQEAPQVDSGDNQENPEMEDAQGKDEAQDYLDKVPDNWGDMHWTQKEKFIKQQEDRGLVEFILRVESLKAVKNACEKRLEELDK